MCERESEREKIRETEKETENHLIQNQNIEIKIEILQKRPTTLNTHECVESITIQSKVGRG